MSGYSAKLELKFSTDDIERFCRLSHDRNPLHVDPDHASRTFFGQQVVYGVLGLLASLRALDPNKPVELEQVSATFHRPLFLGTDYLAEFHDLGPKGIQVQISSGSSGKTSACLRTRPRTASHVPGAPVEGCAPRETAAVVDVESAEGATRAGNYRVGTAELASTLQSLGIDPALIPPLQAAAMCWASYLVGMELPGRQALFYSLDISFDGNVDWSTTELEFDSRVVEADAHVNMLTIESTLSSNGSRFGVAKIVALVRPPPLEYDLAQFRDLIGITTALSGKVAFVSGSSRGLGSLLAIGCAMQGCDVVLHFNRNRAQVEKTREVIENDLGRRCAVVQGDIRTQAMWDNTLSEIRRAFGRLDILVNNAYPPILPLAFDELTDETMNAHIFENIRAAVLAHKTLLPMVCESRGSVVNISSQYAENPPKDFAHYAAAKSAVEGLVRGLAGSTPDVTFITVRPPKIQTDQTNVPVDLQPAVSPFGVVKKVLDTIVTAERPGLLVVDEFQ